LNNILDESKIFVGSGRDYFTIYNENGMIGYAISNCCGHFILAVKK